MTTDADDMAARSRRLAQQILDVLDQPDDPVHRAQIEKKEKRDKDALERFYIASGQRKWVPAPLAEGPLVADPGARRTHCREAAAAGHCR